MTAGYTREFMTKILAKHPKCKVVIYDFGGLLEDYYNPKKALKDPTDYIFNVPKSFSIAGLFEHSTVEQDILKEVSATRFFVTGDETARFMSLPNAGK